jgi:hypothetical protein
MHALRKHSQMLSMTGRPTHQAVAASLGPVFRKNPEQARRCSTLCGGVLRCPLRAVVDERIADIKALEIRE